jgi:hypothetical protein
MVTAFVFSRRVFDDYFAVILLIKLTDASDSFVSLTTGACGASMFASLFWCCSSAVFLSLPPKPKAAIHSVDANHLCDELQSFKARHSQTILLFCHHAS